MRKVVLLLNINKIHEKINGRSVSFVECFEILWITFNRKKHQRVQKQTFRQVSEIFENLQKSSGIFGKNWKMLQSAQDDLPAF